MNSNSLFNVNQLHTNPLQQWMLYQQLLANPNIVGSPPGGTGIMGQGHQFLGNDRQPDLALAALMNPLNTGGMQTSLPLMPVGPAILSDQIALTLSPGGILPTTDNADGDNTDVAVFRQIQNIGAHPVHNAASPMPMVGTALSSENTMSQGKKRNQKLIKLVHARAHDLMGVTKGRDSDGLQSIVLPDPLRNTDPSRSAQDGTRLWNPDWKQDSTFPLNSSYLDAIADLILDQEKAVPQLGNSVSRTDIIKTARQYFRSLRTAYRVQTTEAGKAHRLRKNEMGYRRNRKRAKCGERRNQIQKFRSEYGESLTVGLEQVILTDYMSSEHSDNGEVDEIDYAAHRRRSGGGETGLETRREMWRSEQLNRIYARLQAFVEQERRGTSSSRGGPTRSTRSRGGKTRYVRYRGLHANANNRRPPLGIKTPFISLVSKSWAQSSGNLDIQMVADPTEYTILSLHIPDHDLDGQDLDYLADHEDFDINETVGMFDGVGGDSSAGLDGVAGGGESSSGLETGRA